MIAFVALGDSCVSCMRWDEFRRRSSAFVSLLWFAYGIIRCYNHLCQSLL